MVAEEDEGDEEVWDEVLEEVDGDEAEQVEDEDIMVAQEEAFSTTQPISKITPHLMYTFILRRHPMQQVSTTICDGSLGTDKPNAFYNNK